MKPESHEDAGQARDTPESQPRILVIRGGAIGDFILTLPAIQLIRDHVEGAWIEVLGYKPIIELAEATGFADATRSMEHAALATFFTPGAILDPDWMEYFASFDVVVSFLFDPDGFFRGNLERSEVKTLIECSHRVDETTGHHAAHQLAKPLERLAMFLDDPAPRLKIAPAQRAGNTGGAPLIAVHPGSGSPRKNWGFENWAETCAALSQRFPGAHFLVVTGEAEHTTADDFIALLGDRSVPLTHIHAQPLPLLAQEIARCGLFLGHDSGISHLAGGTGVPCLLLFGPTPPEVWAPRNEAVSVLRAPGGDLSKITPEMVLDSVTRILP